MQHQVRLVLVVMVQHQVLVAHLLHTLEAEAVQVQEQKVLAVLVVEVLGVKVEAQQELLIQAVVVVLVVALLVMVLLEVQEQLSSHTLAHNNLQAEL
jgi:hypothetical protein